MIKFIFKIERYKWNKNFGVYVSNLGHFKDRHKRTLAPMTTNNGYLSIKTELGYKLAHRVVLMTFRPVPDSEILTVDHLNHNKRDNSLSNLEWVTAEENERRASRDKLPIDKLSEPYIYFLYDENNIVRFECGDVNKLIKFLGKKSIYKRQIQLMDKKKMKSRIRNLGQAALITGTKKQYFGYYLDMKERGNK